MNYFVSDQFSIFIEYYEGTHCEIKTHPEHGIRKSQVCLEIKIQVSIKLLN